MKTKIWLDFEICISVPLKKYIWEYAFRCTFAFLMSYPHNEISHCTKKDFSVKDFFSKCDQIPSFLTLLKKSLMENFIFCAVSDKTGICVLIKKIFQKRNKVFFWFRKPLLWFTNLNDTDNYRFPGSLCGGIKGFKSF